MKSILISLCALISLTACSGAETFTGDAFAVRPSDWVIGNPNANVTIIEYSDFQCPACGAVHPILKQTREDFGQDIKFVYRHFTLDYHQNAIPAARAAEAAGQQGKFWEMHDLLFEHQSDWENSPNPKELFQTYARQLNLDINKFKEDSDSRAVLNSIQSDKNDDAVLDIQGTPTLYLNGQVLKVREYPEFKKIIEEAIKNPSAPNLSDPGQSQPL